MESSCACVYAYIARLIIVPVQWRAAVPVYAYIASLIIVPVQWRAAVSVYMLT